MDTKQADKEYLARTGSSEWERVKPFSPTGADTLVESARLGQAEVLALRTRTERWSGSPTVTVAVS